MSCSLRADKLGHACQCGEEKLFLSLRPCLQSQQASANCHETVARIHWTRAFTTCGWPVQWMLFGTSALLLVIAAFSLATLGAHDDGMAR